jgi:hypothetical protein
MKNYLHKILPPISDSLRPFAHILASQNSTWKYEIRKILDFIKKNDSFENFEFLLLIILVFNYFECFTLVWNFFGISEFFMFFEFFIFLKYFLFLINN